MTLYLPTPLRRFADGAREIPAAGSTIREVFVNLHHTHPALAEQLWDRETDSLKKYLNIFVNNKNIRRLQGADTPVREGDIIAVIPVIAGG